MPLRDVEIDGGLLEVGSINRQIGTGVVLRKSSPTF
jgi:hypothetical protein